MNPWDDYDDEELLSMLSHEPRQLAIARQAPDLLSACQSILTHCALVHKHWGDNCNREEAKSAEVAAHAAILKATGR